MMRGFPLRAEAPTMPDLDREQMRERVTEVPPPSGYAEWEALQLAWSRLGDADRKFVARIARVLAEGAVP
jgi:hypothetical protein